MKKVLIIAEGNINAGNGHLTRSKTIYKIIKPFFQTKIIYKQNKQKYKDYDILIFDLPEYNKFLKNYNFKNQKIICIDYNGKYKIDLNFSSILFSKNAKKNCVSIRNIIIDKKNNKITSKNFILLSMGGSDPKNFTKKILKKLIINNNLNIKVILGNLNKIKKI